jgi:hypothetical protein
MIVIDVFFSSLREFFYSLPKESKTALTSTLCITFAKSYSSGCNRHTALSVHGFLFLAFTNERASKDTFDGGTPTKEETRSEAEPCQFNKSFRSLSLGGL